VRTLPDPRYLVALCAALLLAGCAPAPQKPEGAAKSELTTPVFPEPPDEPRYAWERAIFTSADIVPSSEESKLKLALTGVSDQAGEGLGKPYAVAVHKGKIYISDTVSRAIKVFDIAEKKYSKITETPNGDIGKPLGIDVDAAGNLYVADASFRVIHIFDRNGKHVRKIGDGKGFDRLSSVTVNREGTRLYATDIGGVQSENHRIRVYDPRNGEHLMDIGKRGPGPGELNLPRDLAVGKDGRLYVVDSGNFRVQVFDTDGKFIKSFGKVGKMLGDFARPKEIATDRDGNVYVADTAFGNFQIFNPEGELLMFVGTRSEKGGPAKYMLPAGIYVDDDGRIYMGDQWFSKLDIYRPYALPEGKGILYGNVAGKAQSPAAPDSPAVPSPGQSGQK